VGARALRRTELCFLSPCLCYRRPATECLAIGHLPRRYHRVNTPVRLPMNSSGADSNGRNKEQSACPGLFLVGSLLKLRAGALLGRDSGSTWSQLKQ
jgi:hypothetical protein